MKKKAVIILICAAAAAAALWAAREYLPGKERQSYGRREGAADAAAEDRETEYPEASVQEPESAGEPQATEEPAPEPIKRTAQFPGRSCGICGFPITVLTDRSTRERWL